VDPNDLDVVILAQGTQQRMGHAFRYTPKQLLPLKHCDGTAILARTIFQVRQRFPEAKIDLVTWDHVCAGLGGLSDVTLTQLPSPGNSSLKGIARYLELRAPVRQQSKTIVLLGDVVYSWACLDALAVLSAHMGFVGTADLSSSKGELWGVAWHAIHDDAMMIDLRDALLKHPPLEDTYQPGQLRRWVVGWRRGDVADQVAKLIKTGNYVAIDDYTMDVDLPQHVPLLDNASKLAAADDARHNLMWVAS